MIVKIKRNKNGLYDVKFLIDSRSIFIEGDPHVTGTFGNWKDFFPLKPDNSSSIYSYTLKNIEHGLYEYKYLFKNNQSIKWLEVEDYEFLYKDDICTNIQGSKNGFFII